MSRIKTLLFLMALTAQVTVASATVTYAVGSCEPKLLSFTTIMSALGATPAPNVVKVCPGAYTEQVVITFPVTLEGVSASNSAASIIAPPSSGLVANASEIRRMVNPSNHQCNVRILNGRECQRKQVRRTPSPPPSLPHQ